MCTARHHLKSNDLESVIIDDNTYSIQYFLGGDMKFLALVCGIDSATCTHSCIWYNCPKEERYNVKYHWYTEESRTVEEITKKAKQE